MQTEIRKQSFITAPPLIERVPAPSPRVVGFAKLSFVTFTLALFFVATASCVWYFWKLFQNDSYKLVASFLLLILVSNVICKYGLWYWRQYGRSAAA